MTFLKGCPEKRERDQDQKRIADLTTRCPSLRDADDEQMADDEIPRSPRGKKRGLESLQDLGAGSPSSSLQHLDDDEFAEFVNAKVRTDLDKFDLEEIKFAHYLKLKSKMPPSKALAELPNPNSQGKLFEAVYKVYLRQFRRSLDKVSVRSKAGKHLLKCFHALNLKMELNDRAIAEILARIRTLQMTQRPK